MNTDFEPSDFEPCEMLEAQPMMDKSELCVYQIGARGTNKQNEDGVCYAKCKEDITLPTQIYYHNSKTTQTLPYHVLLLSYSIVFF